MIGAGLGFLWFNSTQLKFLWILDLWRLAALAIVAIVTRHEIVLLIMGGLFVLETVSVIVQVISYRVTGRRVFRMAPIHHHFELKGWAEPANRQVLDHYCGFGDHWHFQFEITLN